MSSILAKKTLAWGNEVLHKSIGQCSLEVGVPEIEENNLDCRQYRRCHDQRPQLRFITIAIIMHGVGEKYTPYSCDMIWTGKKNCFIFLPNYQFSPWPLLLKKRSKSSPPAFLLDVLRSQVMMLGWDGSWGRGGLGRFQATPDNYHDFYRYHHCYCHDWYHHEWLPVKISKGTFHAMPFNCNDQDDEDPKDMHSIKYFHPNFTIRTRIMVPPDCKDFSELPPGSAK